MTDNDGGSALVTVVFVDIEGSTALIDRLGDEAGTATVRAQLDAVRERIEPYGGREVKSLGDGLMLAFSSPRLAVGFALASQRALAGTTPRARIAINTGEVLAAAGDPVGGAVNVAARIADRADGGEVLISEVVRQLVGSTPAVRFVDRGRCRLKGLPDRFHLYAAVDRPVEPIGPATIGRTEELIAIEALLAATVAGSGQVLVLEGEAGIGKTHLLNAVIDGARRRGIRELLAASGQHEGALIVAEATWVQTAPIRYFFGARQRAVRLVWLAVAGDRDDLAREVTEAMEEGARRSPALSAAATANRCRGLLDRNPAPLLEAVGLYRKTPLRPDLAACCEDAADVLAERDRRDEAVALLDEAATIHIDIGATGDLARVDALLRRLGARRRRRQQERPTNGWDALTRMERQVTDLVAEGLTNPEIGTRLYISRRTVETHLSHVFAKIGVSSRAQVAAEAARRER